MSKSLGNVLLVRDLLADAPGEAIRFALLSAHYRQPLDWSADGLAQAKRSLDRLYGTLRDLGELPENDGSTRLLAPFEAALEDDLNFPKAIAELYRLAKDARQASSLEDRSAFKAALLEAGQLLGLLHDDPAEWFERSTSGAGDDDGINRLVEARETARSARDFETADRLRKKLTALGITVEDRADGPIWRRTD